MLKQRLLKAFTEETGIKVLQPFNISGYNTPYRLTKAGNVERFISKVWADSSMALVDLVAIVDNGLVSINNDTLIEYTVTNTGTKRRKRNGK